MRRQVYYEQCSNLSVTTIPFYDVISSITFILEKKT